MTIRRITALVVLLACASTVLLLSVASAGSQATKQRVSQRSPRSARSRGWPPGGRSPSPADLGLTRPARRAVYVERQVLRAVWEFGRLAVMVSEARLDSTEHGLVPNGEGWFVLNARDARWRPSEGRGAYGIFEGEPEFPQLGIHLVALAPGEPMAMYHWEADQEDFLVLAGEALLIVEGEERALGRWDLVHCPAGTKHAIVGAGDGPCLVLAVGARDRSTGPDWGSYSVDDTALRHGAAVEQETTDAKEAYARFPAREPSQYRQGWLPE